MRPEVSSSLLWADWNVPGVRALTTLRGPAGVSQPPFDRLNLGSRCGDSIEAVQANRLALITIAGLPAAPRWLQQVHGTQVWRSGLSGDEADGSDDQEPEADAAVGSASDTVLAVLTADCLPVVFAADDGSEIGVAHAGWRGLAAGVLEATVAAMQTPASRLHAWLGPAAGPQAYEVGDEVRAAFLDQSQVDRQAFRLTRPGHWFCDLYALARRRLDAVGVSQVFGGGLCTISDPARFHSHRRDGRGGRMATLVWRSGETP